jgi:hypothetical protein
VGVLDIDVPKLMFRIQQGTGSLDHPDEINSTNNRVMHMKSAQYPFWVHKRSSRPDLAERLLPGRIADVPARGFSTPSIARLLTPFAAP